MTPIDGIPHAALAAWLHDSVGAVPPLILTEIAGGRSNLTVRVEDRDGMVWVVRRPPSAASLPTAHDVLREFRILSALQGSNVPVPEAIAATSDESIIGAPFYVMGFVDGHVLNTAADGLLLSPSARRVASLELVEVMARLHAVDPAAVGLADLGRGGGYIERQLERWNGQLARSATSPGVELIEAGQALAAAVPAQLSVAITHGDLRLGNAVVSPRGEVRAILDWELCTLGDPLADLGWMIIYTEASSATAGLVPSPCVHPGFPSIEELSRRYAELSGRSLGSLSFYVAFAYWRLACIVHSVHGRLDGSAAGRARGLARLSQEALITPSPAPD